MPIVKWMPSSYSLLQKCFDVIERETNREGERKVPEWNGANPENTKTVEFNVRHGDLGGYWSCHAGRSSSWKIGSLEALCSARSGRPIFTTMMSKKVQVTAESPSFRQQSHQGNAMRY